MTGSFPWIIYEMVFVISGAVYIYIYIYIKFSPSTTLSYLSMFFILVISSLEVYKAVWWCSIYRIFNGDCKECKAWKHFLHTNSNLTNFLLRKVKNRSWGSRKAVTGEKVI